MAGEGTLRQRQQRRHSRMICPSRRKSGVDPSGTGAGSEAREPWHAICNSQWPSTSHAASGRGQPEHDAKVLTAVVVPIQAHLYHEVQGSPIWGKRNSMLCGSYCSLCMLPLQQATHTLLLLLTATACSCLLHLWKLLLPLYGAHIAQPYRRSGRLKQCTLL